jgi:signal recognition particle receptor subunit beta
LKCLRKDLISDYSLEMSEDKTYKILVVGDKGVGKSTFIRTSITREWVLWKIENCLTDAKKSYKLELCEFNGSQITKEDCKSVLGAFVIIDVKSFSSLIRATRLKADLVANTDWKQNYLCGTCPVILLVNKNESFDALPSYDDICEGYGFDSWFGISATNGRGLKTACKTMVNICKRSSCNQSPCGSIVPKSIDSPTFAPEALEPSVPLGYINKVMMALLVDLNSMELHQYADSRKVTEMRVRIGRVYFEVPEIVSAEEKKKWAEIFGPMSDILGSTVTDTKKIELLSKYILDYGQSMSSKWYLDK